MNQRLPLLLCLFCGIAGADTTNYTIDNAHTHIIWEVDRFGFTQTMGSFTEVEGLLSWDAADPTNSSVTASIALSGLRSDLPLREGIVRGSFWLDAEQFPDIVFESSRVAQNSVDDCATVCLLVTGNLTLKGQTQPVTLSVTLNKSGTDPVSQQPAIGFSAIGEFNRSDFGINTAMGPIGEVVEFRIEVLAIASE